MDTKEPSFLIDHQSVASLITQLHEYFKDSHSHYKVERSHLISQLDGLEGEEEQQALQEVRKTESEIALFGILSDALSIADRVLHTRAAMKELGLDNPVYKMHYDVEVVEEKDDPIT
jgi:hypothetical protein